MYFFFNFFSPPALMISPLIPSFPKLVPFFSWFIALSTSSYRISSSSSSLGGGDIISSSVSKLFFGPVSLYQQSLQYSVCPSCLCFFSVQQNFSIIVFFIAVCLGCHFLFRLLISLYTSSIVYCCNISNTIL